MSSKDAHLYGVPRPKKASGKEISSSSSLAFTSQLSSLISTSKTTTNGKGTSRSTTISGRVRPKKDDIFSKHNRDSRKRALADMQDTDHTVQKHSTSSEGIDAATWRRAKRKMEEKARLYAAMKRGDVEDLDERHMVDFDRKWAEAEGRGEAARGEDTSSGEDDVDSEEEELVEYVDEFGRTRRGTQAEAARAEYTRMGKAAGKDAADRFTARPVAPSGLIFGDTIQHAAFNPDEPIAQQMADLAAKRDRSLTPPPATHFDARQEVRQKGQGFFQFSVDEEERKKQMDNLDQDRLETERRRAENSDRKEKRRQEVEERRRAILKKRSEKEADRFLGNLMNELNGAPPTSLPAELSEPEGGDDGSVEGTEAPNPGSVLRKKLDRLDHDDEENNDRINDDG